MRLIDSLRGAGRRSGRWRPVTLVNAGLALAVLGVGGWAYHFIFAEPTAGASANSARTVPVMQGTVTATVTADGNVESASTASAVFGTSGTVTEIRVKIGQTVKKGQILARVDATAAQRDLTYAKANLAAAEESLDRAEDAGDDTSEAETQVTDAEQAVEEAQDAVDGTVLTAPMAGTVIAVNGSIGGTSGGGTSESAGSSGSSSGGGSSGGGSGQSASSSGGSDGFIDLANLGKLQVSASFSETDATKLKAGQAATVTWNALPDTTATGKVAAIDPNATTSNSVVTYPATVTLDEVPDGAKLGQTVSVSVVTGEAQDAVYVNSAAVTTVGNRHMVTVLGDDGQRTTTVVEVGLEGDQAVQILSGVNVGDRVVLPTTTSTTGNSRNQPGGGFPGGGMPAGGGFPGGGTRTGSGGNR